MLLWQRWARLTEQERSCLQLSPQPAASLETTGRPEREPNALVFNHPFANYPEEEFVQPNSMSGRQAAMVGCSATRRPAADITRYRWVRSGLQHPIERLVNVV